MFALPATIRGLSGMWHPLAESFFWASLGFVGTLTVWFSYVAWAEKKRDDD